MLELQDVRQQLRGADQCLRLIGTGPGVEIVEACVQQQLLRLDALVRFLFRQIDGLIA